jgi:hypothetical protein
VQRLSAEAEAALELRLERARLPAPAMPNTTGESAPPATLPARRVNALWLRPALERVRQPSQPRCHDHDDLPPDLPSVTLKDVKSPLDCE